jgi:hypothetical protein
VSIAQVLGDNGTAIEHARTVAPGAIPTAERRGRYSVDVARAYHQWGKPDRCYQALLAAEQAAPAEVRHRPPVHRMAEDLMRTDRRPTAGVELEHAVVTVADPRDIATYLRLFADCAVFPAQPCRSMLLPTCASRALVTSLIRDLAGASDASSHHRRELCQGESGRLRLRHDHQQLLPRRERRRRLHR